MNNALQGHETALSSQSGSNTTDILTTLTGWVFLGGCVAMILTLSTIHQILSSRRTSHRSFNETPLLPVPSDPIHEAIKKISKKHRFVTVLRDSLPPGWEVGINVQGDIYYVDHNQQRTSWNHPVLSPHAVHKLLEPLTLTGDNIVDTCHIPPVPPVTPQTPVSRSAAPSLSLTIPSPAHLQTHETEEESRFPPSATNSDSSFFSLDDTPSATSSPLFDDFEALPEGWEMAVTAMGIPYYINHSTRQTTWVDPRTRRPSVASTQSVFLLAQLHSKRHPPLGRGKGKLRNTSTKPKISISTVNMQPFTTTICAGETTGYSVHH